MCQLLAFKANAPTAATFPLAGHACDAPLAELLPQVPAKAAEA